MESASQSDGETEPGSEVDDDVAPIFLLSTERSGSNLVRSILNTHSEISAPHPLETAYPWRKVRAPHEMTDRRARKLLRDVLVNKHYSFHPLETGVDLGAVNQIYRAIEDHHSLFDVQRALYTVYARAEGSEAWASKYPALWDCLDEAFEHYDDLRIVYLVRDPRDVVLSFKRSNVGRYHPYFNAKRWVEEQRRGIELLEEHGDAVHLLRYKDLLQDPESVVRGICDGLDRPYEQEMLYYYETDEAQAASESAEVFENLTSPIMSDNYDKFHEQLPDNEVAITEKVVGDALEYFDYENTLGEDELAEFELDVDDYEAEDRRLTRRWRLRHWRDNPREQVRREATRSFAGYMILRYGVFG